MRRTALILIDFINEFSFEGGAQLARRAVTAARATAQLRDRLRAKRQPIIYANDNFGRWRSDFKQVVARCSVPDSPGRTVTTLLHPGPTDHFVLKPKNSAFYETPLEPLLDYLRVSRLILAGLAADNCVLFTANDAHLREYDLWIPGDCVVGASRSIEKEAQRYFQRVLHADVRPSTVVRHV